MTKFFTLFFIAIFAGVVSAADGPKFHDDFEEALQEAKATGKPMVTIFSAKWCGPCQKMKRSVYPSSEVAPYHDSFVWAYLDADSGKNRPLMKQFQVSGIPHISFVSPGGEMIDSMRGAVAPDAFAKVLSSTLSKSPSTTPVSQTSTATEEPEPKKKGFFGLFKKKG